MPFTQAQIKKRRSALAAIKAAEELELKAKDARNREERQVRAMLKSAFREVHIRDAEKLWKIATSLTDELVVQFEEGKHLLRAVTTDWQTLFIASHFSFSNGGARFGSSDKGYLPVLQRMGKLHNDIEQTFTLEKMLPREWAMQYQDPRIRIVASAPIPLREQVVR